LLLAETAIPEIYFFILFFNAKIKKIAKRPARQIAFYLPVFCQKNRENIHAFDMVN